VPGRSDDAAPIDESVTPLKAAPDRTKEYTEVGETVAGILRAAEEAAEQIRTDARAQGNKIMERARVVAEGRIEELTREAERVRREAEDYASDIRAAVEGYASQQRREAEEEAGRILERAEEQARAMRAAAEGMAEQIEGDARQRNEQLRDEARSLEERRQRVLEEIREMVAQLNELIPTPAARKDEGELLDALPVERPR
jgi:vacuolar-type H+-ATPase subunit E/Vma4